MDKEPGALNGTGTETDPFIIMSIEDLVYFSQQVNEGVNTYSNQYVKLGKSLNFNGNLSYGDANTKEYDIYLGGEGTTGLKEQLTNGNGFRPIGETSAATSRFAGNFDGNNNTIKNIKVETDGIGGLFGYIWGGNEENPRTIKNLTITGNINAGYYAGGIVGRSFGSDCIKSISECFNYGDITSKGPTGGLIGESYSARIQIKNSINFGKIEGADGGLYPGVGGIIGGGPSGVVTIVNSSNYGKLLGGIRVGGIRGNGQTSSTSDIYANVFNIGKTEKCDWTPGGLAGQDTRFGNYINSYYSSQYQYGIGWGSVVAGTKYTEEQLKDSSFVDELNANIENGCPYEVENEDGTTKTLTIDTTGWAKWVYNKNSYPTLDITTIWNGTDWEKIEK